MNASLREQLRPIREDLRKGRPEVRAISQVTCGLVGTPADAVRQARTTILEWLRDKQQVQGIPARAWEGASFEIDVTQDRPVQVEAHDSVWAMRYDNPDARIASRIWRTEAILAWRADVALVGIRLAVISRRWDLPVDKSVPRVVTSLSCSPGLTDYGITLSPRPIDVDSKEAVEDLISMLENPRRVRPVYVISENASGQFLVDPDRLASQTAALAHVVRLRSGAAWILSELIGKRQSVFGGAIRTYNPGFDTLHAKFDEHPVATPDWLARRFSGEHTFAEMLVRRAIDSSVSGSNLEQSLPSFAAVRRGLAERRVREARAGQASQQELLNLYEDDNTNLRAELAAAEDLARQMESQLAAERTDKERLAADRFRLRARIEQLESARSDSVREEPIDYPESLDELDEWVGRFLGDHLILLTRALRSARKSEYADPGLIYESLRLLGRQYRDQRLGAITREQFDQACNDLGVTVSRSGDESRLLQWREQYEVEWRGEKRLLDMHLKKGVSRDVRNCLRIYFLFDDETEQVVVGHLPNHLTTDAT